MAAAGGAGVLGAAALGSPAAGLVRSVLLGALLGVDVADADLDASEAVVAAAAVFAGPLPEADGPAPGPAWSAGPEQAARAHDAAAMATRSRVAEVPRVSRMRPC